MKTIALVLAIFTLLIAGCVRASSGEQLPTWLVGFWAQTQDEDGSAGDETLEFRADGSLITYNGNCEPLPAAQLHLFAGNYYATWKGPKGPIALVYVPSADHKSITFTSPRTGNNATYEPSRSCIPVAG